MSERIRSAEFVFPGHPDKLSDAIADALVQEAGRRERRALVGVEVAVHRDRVFVTGRIACDDADKIDVPAIVRQVYRSAGYGNGWSPAPDEVRVEVDLCIGPLEDGEAEFRALADDQSICTGYAVAIPETNYLPVEHWLANRLGRRLTQLRGDHQDLALGLDGKVIVIVGESDEPAWTLRGFSCSLQQRAGADDIALHRVVRRTLESELKSLSETLPHLSAKVPEEISVNGVGAFDVGGPEGDNGLSGKKLVVDAYGPGVPIGGGALSGKDFFKADRAGALHARRVAKAVVMTGAAREATVTLCWFPGEPSAQLLSIESGDGKSLDVTAWSQFLDLSLEGSGEAWTGGTNLAEVARFGHFTSATHPWEQLRIPCWSGFNGAYGQVDSAVQGGALGGAESCISGAGADDP